MQYDHVSLSTVVPRTIILLIYLSAPSLCFADGRTNILLIIADDLGMQLGAYGESLIATPHLDDLANTGVRFETAYVTQASCSPSRSSIFTGLHVYANGHYGLSTAGFSLHPELVSETLPNRLKVAGYRTGVIGKIHVSPSASLGFDSVIPGETRDVQAAADKAEHFLDGGVLDPFFLVVSFTDPHVARDPETGAAYFPAQVNELPENVLPADETTLFDFQGLDTQAQRIRTAGYYNAVQRLDAGVGMLMDLLRERGLDSNTLVIFLGDHGPPFDRAKTTTYEAGLRVPLILRWPDVIPASPVNSALASTLDLLPTILDAAGLTIPSTLHGASLRAVIADPDAVWREYLVGEFHAHHDPNRFFPRRAIRDRRFKLIHNLLPGLAKPLIRIDGDGAYDASRDPVYEGTLLQQAYDVYADPPEYELYDLAVDPHEFYNLADDPAYVGERSRLAGALEEYRARTGDPFLDEAFLVEFIDSDNDGLINRNDSDDDNDGLYDWVDKEPLQNTGAVVGSVADFGLDGVWRYDGAGWIRIANWDAGAGGVAGWSGGLAADFDANGFWTHDGTTWRKRSGWDPGDAISGWSGGVAVDFDADGLWSYDGTGWRKLTGWNAEALAGWSGGLAADFGSDGLWVHDGTGWTKRAGWNPGDGGMSGWSEGLAVDFDAEGLWVFDGSLWTKTATWDPGSGGMSGWAGGLAVHFTGRGTWSYDGTDWRRLSNWNPGDGGLAGFADSLAADYDAQGLWIYEPTGWAKRAGWNPEAMGCVPRD
ncbi:MAG: sulfatase [Thiohalocapsa sp.]|nr:sulfatase [Thiohalocapsa sp.]MCF7993041.1 sulfatase [Thiohalocapsa sp.]